MYVLLSDLHLHNWSAFASTNDEKVNTRLQIIIDEINRAASELIAAGGSEMYLAGDLFHVRGKISPTVLNPVLDCFQEIVGRGIDVYGISGNHDIESDDASDLSSSATALRKVGVKIFNKPTFIKTGGRRIALVPYIDKIDELRATIMRMTEHEFFTRNADLIIHAPVDGVIKGLPEHGLDPMWLATSGFNRVFSGHYHNHVDFENGVYSIGATTHQTWGDLNSKAGFLLVDSDDVTYRASRAPSFVEITGDTDVDEVPLIVDGNYVRATLEVEAESQVEEMRQFLKDSGAKGVVIHKVAKTASVSRTGATAKTGESVEKSVGNFIKAREYKRESELMELCSSILSKAEGEE